MHEAWQCTHCVRKRDSSVRPSNIDLLHSLHPCSTSTLFLIEIALKSHKPIQVRLHALVEAGFRDVLESMSGTRLSVILMRSVLDLLSSQNGRMGVQAHMHGLIHRQAHALPNQPAASELHLGIATSTLLPLFSSLIRCEFDGAS